MERILILLQAESWADAAEALQSAKDNAFRSDALTYALTLPDDPTEQEKRCMAEFGAMQYLVSAEMTFADMESLWQGERYVLHAHPAMRFCRGWEHALLNTLNSCGTEQAVLTGYLPAEDDPIGAVCPVAAERLDGTALHFSHGLPLKQAAHPMAGLFLHPDFFFAPAGFVRIMAQQSGTLTTRLLHSIWQVFTLHVPVIEVTQDLPVPPETLDPESASAVGIDLSAGAIPQHVRRGFKADTLDVPLNVSPLMKLTEAWKRRQERKHGKLVPLCVTVCTEALDEEGTHWLRQLTQMADLSLLCYTVSSRVREIAQFHPNVLEYKDRYALKREGKAPLFSRAAVLSAARDRVLSGTHYVWIAPDCVRYPLYAGLALKWREICSAEIVLARVQGKLDLSMIVVPDERLKPLLDAMDESLRAMTSAGNPPESEDALWDAVVSAHPDWFAFFAMPVEKQLFTKLLD